MAKTKVRMTGDSWNIKAGQEVSVESEVADQLVADGHAVRPSAKKTAEPAGAEAGSTATRSGTAKRTTKKS